MEFCLPWISVQQLHEKFVKQKQLRLSPKLYSCCHKLLFLVFVLLFDFLRREGGGEMWEWYFVIRWCNCDASQPAREFFYNLPPPPTSIYQSSVDVDIGTNKRNFVSVGCSRPASSWTLSLRPLPGQQLLLGRRELSQDEDYLRFWQTSNYFVCEIIFYLFIQIMINFLSQ